MPDSLKELIIVWCLNVYSRINVKSLKNEETEYVKSRPRSAREIAIL
jgi:hypothetical protein